MASLKSKPGITNASTGQGVPDNWNRSWFQQLIKTGLQYADVRNAVGANGITVSGNVTQYGTISLSYLPTGIVTDASLSPTSQIYAIDQSYNRTAAEIAAGVTPSNYAFPELHVHRYGAVGDGSTNDLPAWSSAVSVAATGKSTSGEILCEQLPYLFGGIGTLAITASGIVINGRNPYNSYTAGVGNGAQIRSTTNAPIISCGANTGNGVAIKNINIVGSVSAGSSQDGLVASATYPAYTKFYIENVNIWNCGRYGFNAGSMYVSRIESLYVQGCTSIGIYQGANCGANVWINCSAASNGSSGFDLGSTNGSDVFYGCISETNSYGVAFENGSVANTFHMLHTENNSVNAVLFKSGSNRNRVDFEQWGAGGETIVNFGGAQNRWSGNQSGGTILYDSKLVQRVGSSSTNVVTGSTLTATPYTNTLPTTSQGLQVFSQSITAQASGNVIVARATGFAEIATTGVATISVYQAGSIIKAVAIQATGGAPFNFAVEAQTNAGTTASQAFTVYISSSTASDSVSMGGHAGSRIYGGAETASFWLEEFYPSSG
jgi:hypothetical protein